MMEKTYLIIGALDEEVNALLSLMENSEKKTLHTIEYHQGTLAGASVIVALSGIGKVNAAYTATILMNEFKPTEVINIGSAGGLDDQQSVGDIVVATELRYHDLFLGDSTDEYDDFTFKTDVSDIESVLETLKLPYYKGLIVSGDQFVTKGSSSFNNILENFKDAIAVEMEATAIAAVASKFDIPFIVLRALSDVTHTDDNYFQYDQYLDLASKNSALICETYLKKKADL